MKTWPLVLAALLSTPLFAAENEAPEQLFRVDRYHVDYVLNEDGSNVRTYDSVRTVLSQKALEAMRQARVTHSTSVEKAEVLEAYTKKSGGARIDVPKSNYQVSINQGRAGGSPAFSDTTAVTVIFPEVEVGDSVVLRYRIEQAEAIFPKHFSVMDVFVKTIAYGDVKIRVDAPASMKAQYEGRGMKQSVRKAKDRQVVEWTWKNKDPIKSKRRNYSAFDLEQEVGLSWSTFDSYAGIAEAYAVRARPKAAVTERVQKLADEIVGKRKDRREQARALYDWVATKVGYAGNCIGVGVVVPRDLSFVLDNSMGDCKDHATLLQALLSAKGIPSTQALVNAGPVYRLPRIPVVSNVNHVINYIPEMELYLDSTSSDTPFGMLPFFVADKRVLLIDGFRDDARTPVTPIGTNEQHMTSVIEVKADGSISARVDVKQRGLFAANSREWMRNFPKDQEADFVKNVFQRDGRIASGNLRKDDPAALLDRYAFGMDMNVEAYIHRPEAGAFTIQPLFNTEAPVARYAWGAMEVDEVDVACSSGTAIEEYTYTFPVDMQILSIPENVEIKNHFLSYEARYKLDGRKLTVLRRFEDRTPGNVCSPALMAEYKALTEKVIPNMRAQVLYK